MPKIAESYQVHLPNAIYFRGGKKVDIYRLGVVALSLAEGEIVQDVFIPKQLPPDFSNFLQRCLDKDERERWSAEQVQNSYFLAAPFKMLFRVEAFDRVIVL